MPQDSRLRKILNDVEDYEETVIAIITFSHEACWDSGKKRTIPDSCFMIGRRMGKIDSTENSEHALAPDIVVQLNNKYGIIAEVKKKFPSEKSHWNKTFEQIKRYDDNLIGWITQDETIKNYDLALLTHITRKVDISDYYKEHYESNKNNFTKKFAIVAFNRGGEGKEYMYLEKHYGEFSDSNLNERLRRVVAIPLETVLPIYSIKFYDSPPPIAYLIDILWTYIFPQFLSQESDVSEYPKNSLIKLDITEVTQKLQKQFSYMSNDGRQQEIPRHDWVKVAFEVLMQLKLARRNFDNPAIYEVDFKSIKNPLDYFARKMTKPKKRKSLTDNVNQMSLPKIEED